MIDFDNPFVFISIIFFGIISIVIGGVIIIQFADITFFNNIPVQVYVHDKLVFEGINGCVSVGSSGDTTSIKTHHGFLCLFPLSTYTGRDVRIEGLS